MSTFRRNESTADMTDTELDKAAETMRRGRARSVAELAAAQRGKQATEPHRRQIAEFDEAAERIADEQAYRQGRR